MMLHAARQRAAAAGLEAEELARRGPGEERADLSRRSEKGFARHGDVEGEVVAVQAAEGDAGGTVPLDQPHQPAAGYLEHATAGGAVADRRVGLHPALQRARAGLVGLELAAAARTDGERLAVGRADHHHVVADVDVLLGGERDRRKLLLDGENREVLVRHLTLVDDPRRHPVQARPLDHHHEEGRPGETLALHYVRVGEHVAAPLVGGDHHAARGPCDLAPDLHFDAHALLERALRDPGAVALRLRWSWRAGADSQSYGCEECKAFLQRKLLWAGGSWIEGKPQFRTAVSSTLPRGRPISHSE